MSQEHPAQKLFLETVAAVLNKNQTQKLVPGLLLVAHDCGYPLSRYTCRATRVATDFLDFYSVLQV